MRNPFRRRSRKQALAEQSTTYSSKHRKTLTVTLPAQKRTLYSVDYTVTKTPPWIKRRKNREANRVARRARRVNRLRRAK